MSDEGRWYQVPSLSASETEARAMAELQRMGIDVDPSLVVADGRLRRYRTSADSATEASGWIVVHAGAWPCMLYGDWRDDGECGGKQTVRLWTQADKPLSTEERHAFDAEMARRRETRETERRRTQNEAAGKARSIIAKAREATSDFPYCLRKHVPVSPGLKITQSRHPKKPKNEPPEDTMLVPLKNVAGEVRSCQRIYADGFKANLFGAEKQKLFYEFPGHSGNASFCIICEGWATGASIAQASNGATVFSVCDVGNIEPVCQALVDAGRFTPDKMLICGDNDWATGVRLYLEAAAKGQAEGKTPFDFNPGARTAKRVAEKLGCRWTLAVPDKCAYPSDGRACSDANDLAVSKIEECMASGMKEAEARATAVATVQAMLARGWEGECRTAKDNVPEPPKQLEQIKPLMAFIPFSEAVNLTIPPELIVGLVPTIGIGYLYGPSGSYKTFVAMQIGFHVSEGLSIAGHKIKRKPVYYLLLEGSSGLGKRTRALNLWRQNKGLTATGIYMFWPKPFNLLDSENVDTLIYTITSLGHEGALVIIDTQSQATVNVDEDKGKDMKPVIASARHISESIKGVVMLIAHMGKNEANGLAGSYKQKADVDFTLEVKKSNDSAILKTNKVKENKDDQAIVFDIIVQEVGYDEDGEPVSSCVAVPSLNTECPQEEQKLSPRLERALDILKSVMNEKKTNRVYLEDWRLASYMKSARGDQNGKRSEFNKNKADLINLHIIDVEDDYFWIVNNEKK